MTDWRYTLTADELRDAAEVGAQMRARSRARGRREVLAAGMGAVVDQLGLAGQIATARLLGLDYEVKRESLEPHKGDLPGGLEVRTRASDRYSLWLHQGDDQQSLFVLVTGSLPMLWARGWIRGYDAMTPERWDHPSWADAPGWFVEADELQAMETLPRCLLDGLPDSHRHSVEDALARQRAREGLDAGLDSARL